MTTDQTTKITEAAGPGALASGANIIPHGNKASDAGKQAVCDAFRKSIGGDTTEHKAEECWISNQHHGLVRSGKRKG